MVRRTQSKKYAGKMSKTFIAREYFTKYPEKTNEEIAIILSNDISKTSKEQVEVMRSRWKSDLKKAISSHPELSKQVRKTITSDDFKNSFLGACTTISDQVEKRAAKYSNKETIDLFSNVIGIAKGGN